MTEQNNNTQTFHRAVVATGESTQITNYSNLQSWDVNYIEAAQKGESNQKRCSIVLSQRNR